MLEEWPVRFPGSVPVAHDLRSAFPDRWVRFHSLPGSQRYPETEAEYKDVVNRHNRVLAAVTRPGDPVVLLTTGFSASQAPSRDATLDAFDPDGRLWRTVPMHEFDGNFDDPTYWHVFASRLDWSPGRLDPLVRAVADCEVSNLMVVAPDCRWLVHPYDSGMDVIAESTSHRDRLRLTFAEWLSGREDGL